MKMVNGAMPLLLKADMLDFVVETFIEYQLIWYFDGEIEYEDDTEDEEEGEYEDEDGDEYEDRDGTSLFRPLIKDESWKVQIHFRVKNKGQNYSTFANKYFQIFESLFSLRLGCHRTFQTILADFTQALAAFEKFWSWQH